MAGEKTVSTEIFGPNWTHTPCIKTWFQAKTALQERLPGKCRLGGHHNFCKKQNPALYEHNGKKGGGKKQPLRFTVSCKTS